MYLYIQKGVFLSSKEAFPKVFKGVAPKNFPGASPPDPHLSLPPHFAAAGAAAGQNREDLKERVLALYVNFFYIFNVCLIQLH